MIEQTAKPVMPQLEVVPSARLKDVDLASILSLCDRAYGKDLRPLMIFTESWAGSSGRGHFRIAKMEN